MLFLISTISSTGSGVDTLTSINPILTKYCIALMKSESGMLSSAHHPAVFLTQSGIILSGPGGAISVGGMLIMPSLISDSNAFVKSL